MNLHGKRLLHLGGALFQIPSLACAKKLGCHVIIVDQNPEVPGRTYADSFEQVSTRDIENVLNVAKEYKIDGVMTYASDSSVITVAHVAQQMGLSGNPVKAAESLRRKDLFREFQKEIGLPHPFFFATDSLGEAIERVDTLEFPLVVKPVDASGTKGQTIIYGKREVARAFEDSIRQSLVKRVIFENFIRTDMMELDGDVWFKNGKLAFRHYGHNHFLENRISNVPSGEIFPGFFGDELAMQIDRQFQKIIEGLGLNSGCMNFDALASDGKVYIVDIGLRNGGNFVPDLIKLSTGFDLTEAAIYSALGIDYPDSGLYCKAPEPVASYLIGSRFRGRFEGLDVNQEIKEYVIETKLFSEIGSEVKPFTKADFAAGIMFLRFPDMDTLKEKISVIEDMVKLRIVPIRLPQKQYTENSQERSPKRGTSILGNFKEFPELISPFLRNKLAKAEEENNQTVLRVISRQYIESIEEQNYDAEDELKHYEAGETLHWHGERLYGVERLYRRVIVFEPLYQCVAHCRYCLRRNYEPFHQTQKDIKRIANYIGKGRGHEELREVLVTGGDPFLVPHKVEQFLNDLAEEAPQIRIVRIASRLPIQQPDRINERILSIIGGGYPFRVEVATQINHAAELFPEVEDAYRKILDVVRIVYNQTVLLTGVNDTIDELVELFDRTRLLGIESHYIFHCVPIGGLDSLRPTLDQFVILAHHLTSCGRISGRSKPQFAVMTSIGKITLYEGSIIEHKDNKYLLKSYYTLKERLEWNPTWQLPKNGLVGNDGKLYVWYEDVVS